MMFSVLCVCVLPGQQVALMGTQYSIGDPHKECLLNSGLPKHPQKDYVLCVCEYVCVCLCVCVCVTWTAGSVDEASVGVPQAGYQR